MVGGMEIQGGGCVNRVRRAGAVNFSSPLASVGMFLIYTQPSLGKLRKPVVPPPDTLPIFYHSAGGIAPRKPGAMPVSIPITTVYHQLVQRNRLAF